MMVVELLLLEDREPDVGYNHEVSVEGPLEISNLDKLLISHLNALIVTKALLRFRRMSCNTSDGKSSW